MSAVALAATEAAPHPQPHTAAAGARSRDGGMTVRVPLRLVVGAQYPDVALSTYVKVKALALRPEGCRAKVATLAQYLGMSKSSLERGLRPLTNPDSIDGITEVPTVRKTARGGTGESAHRVTRKLSTDELWVRIPVRAAEALTPRLLCLYTLLTYSADRRIPVTVAELGEMLHHHTGEKAGECLGERQVRRLVDELEATGWLTVHRREGEQGRHAYETHRHPLHAVAAPAAVEEAPSTGQLPLWEGESPATDDGSGSDLGDGSLASKEDPQTDRPDQTTPVGVSRRRRGDGKWGPTPVDNAGAPLPHTFRPGPSRAARGNHPTTTRPSYTGPELRWTQRIHTSLGPVRHLLSSKVSRFMLRRVAREIGRQLDDVAVNLVTPERMAARIATRYRDAREINDVGAWLLAVAVVPGGCGMPLCEDGYTWPTGEPCETCAHKSQIAREEWRRARAWDEQLIELRRRDLAKATYPERTEASDEEVLAVAAAYGPELALHRYGVLRAGELLRSAYGAANLPVPLPPPAASPFPRATEEMPMRDDYMPPSFRASVGRAALTGALTIPCPEPGCLADEGQPCHSQRGRRRAEPHSARTAAAGQRAEETS
ncbi:hypothetical protein JHN63_02075 [Streptomyces sp. MBT65]|uniref:zinc finger domain-containing protein n=1 Tax=Streptomyces sp. MBT65 TaxID=1488395 RepID=UPI00190CEE07|nr:hypothetical protein [Streptomyces sp. MBT65]MBK3572629.1 hypothetical protein [Streptomyces sp. MBT65]